MKKRKLLLITAIVSLFLPFVVSAKEAANVYIFKGKTCGYCAKALAFFEELEKDADYKDKFNLVEYEVWYNEANASLGSDVAESLGESLDGVPYIVIGDKTFSGYASSYDDDIKKAIDTYYEKDNRKDIVAETISKNSYTGLEAEGTAIESSSTKESNADTYIAIAIIVIAVVGFGYVIYLSRKDTSVPKATKKEVKKEEKVIEPEVMDEEEDIEEVKEEPKTEKKANAKQTNTNKNKSTAKKKSNKKTNRNRK